MVSASQSTNALGLQTVFDYGNPGIVTGKALTVLSGGDLVMIHSGTAALTGSDASTYQTSDLIFQKAEDVKLFNGIVTQNAGSNSYVSVATKGGHLMRAGGIVSGGAFVMHNASGNVLNWTPLTGSGAVQYDVLGPAVVGRAMQSSASGTNLYCVVSLI